MIRAHVLRSRKKGFRIYLMRWNDDGKIGGAGIRAFGRCAEFYNDDPWTPLLSQLRHHKWSFSLQAKEKRSGQS